MKARNWMFVLALVVLVLGAAAAPAWAQKPPLDPLTLTVGASSKVTIEITVTAGSSGAPAGFSLQWMTAQQFADNGNQWFLSDDPALCKASCSGRANESRFPLGPGDSATVTIGDLFDDEPGVSFNCDELECGTTYVFRAFAHATKNRKRSASTGDDGSISGSTLACSSCTFSQGFWKTHFAAWPQDVLDNGLTLGTVSYTAVELLSIFNRPAAGNGLISLAHHLIAAKLNIANGADGSAVATAIASADAMIGGLVIPPVGSGSLAPSATASLAGVLASYNTGIIGPGHCEE